MAEDDREGRSAAWRRWRVVGAGEDGENRRMLSGGGGGETAADLDGIYRFGNRVLWWDPESEEKEILAWWLDLDEKVRRGWASWQDGKIGRRRAKGWRMGRSGSEKMGKRRLGRRRRRGGDRREQEREAAGRRVCEQGGLREEDTGGGGLGERVWRSAVVLGKKTWVFRPSRNKMEPEMVEAWWILASAGARESGRWGGGVVFGREERRFEDEMV